MAYPPFRKKCTKLVQLSLEIGSTRAILVHVVFARDVIDVFFRCKILLCGASAVDTCVANHGALEAY